MFSKAFRTEQSVGQMNEQKYGNRARDDVIHGVPPYNRSQDFVEAQQPTNKSIPIKT